MNIATLLADPAAIRPIKIIQGRSSLTLVVRTTQPNAIYPRCHQPSAQIHSRYLRRVADLPWQGVAVQLQLSTRHFRCQNSLCPQRIFCERLPSVVAHYARKTVRLNATLELIDFAIGGEAGAAPCAETRSDRQPRHIATSITPSLTERAFSTAHHRSR
jgi:transposase